MKKQIKDLALNSKDFIQDMEELVKEEVSKAVNKVIFYCASIFVLGTVIYQFIIK